MMNDKVSNNENTIWSLAVISSSVPIADVPSFPDLFIILMFAEAGTRAAAANRLHTGKIPAMQQTAIHTNGISISA